MNHFIIFSSSKYPPTAMMDLKGNVATSAAAIDNLATEHYKQVLRNRTIKAGLGAVQKDKEELSGHRLELASKHKTQPWNLEDLELVLKYLKKNETRDPLGNANR